jgi:hypothetical protein
MTKFPTQENITLRTGFSIWRTVSFYDDLKSFKWACKGIKCHQKKKNLGCKMFFYLVYQKPNLKSGSGIQIRIRAGYVSTKMPRSGFNGYLRNGLWIRTTERKCPTALAKQCWGFGSVCFWASRIRILPCVERTEIMHAKYCNILTQKLNF